MGEAGWGYVVAAYTVAALVLVLYELKLRSELGGPGVKDAGDEKVQVS